MSRGGPCPFANGFRSLTITPHDFAMIAFATYSAQPDLTPDDRLAADVLAGRGLPVVGVPWDSADVDWGRFDAVVIRSTWNYHVRPREFMAWLDRLAAAGVPTWNPVPFLRWNADKRYLVDLAGRGTPTVPTTLLPRGSHPALRALLASLPVPSGVLKPTFAAGAHETWVTTADTAAAHEPRLHALLSQTDVLLQPFVPEITTDGEWSLIFFNDQFSHAVLKRPKAGDFRVQSQHGGTERPADPPDHVLAQARRVLGAVDTPLLYARVDGVDIDGTFTLMELEALEPHLFLSTSPDAPSRFADAIVSVIAR